MPLDILTAPPATLVAGDTCLFTRSFRGFPSAEWYLDFILTRLGQNLKTLRATNSGTDFLVSVRSVDTGGMVPGQCRIFYLLTQISDGERTTVEGDPIYIQPNPLLGISETPAMKSLALAKAKLDIMLSGVSASTIMGNQMVDRSITQQQEIIDRLQDTVWRELRDMGVDAPGGARQIIHSFR